MENEEADHRIVKMEAGFEKLDKRLTEVETEVHKFNTTLKFGFAAGGIIAFILVAIFTFVFNRVETMFEGYVEIRTTQAISVDAIANHDTLVNHRNNDQPVALLTQEVSNLKADIKSLERIVNLNY